MTNVTVLSPFGIIFMVAMIALLVALPRKFAFIPFLLSATLMTEQQRICIAGFDFTMLRILIVAAFLRILSRHEHQGFGFQSFDRLIIIYVIVGITTYVALRGGNISALSNRLGFAINALGLYFVPRILIRTDSDLRITLVWLSVAVCAMAAFMTREHVTGQNLFSVFGGVPEFTEIRDGKLRCQGAFEHPLLAGAFGATSIPLLVQLVRDGSWYRWVGIVAVAMSLVIVVNTSSSGPVLAAAAAFGALLAWPIRNYMRPIRWGILLMLLGLHLLMKAPVWALIARMAVIGGSTGYHRFEVVDQAIRHVGEWFLLGTVSTAHWGWGLWDITNQYVAEGVNAGFVGLILFILLIVKAYSRIGAAMHAGCDDREGKKFWAMGAALFAHNIAFLGQSYFGGQVFVGWYLLLSTIVTFTSIRIAQQHQFEESSPISWVL